MTQGRVVGYTPQAAIHQAEESRRAYQEAEQQRIWEYQQRDKERIMQLEGIVEKSKRGNEELLEMMI